MNRNLYAQGDVLIEEVETVPTSGTPTDRGVDGGYVLAEGEATGHRHIIKGCATMFRDDALARDIPTELYIGHLRVDDDSARVLHEEHAAIPLNKGMYRVRRQRELEPKDARIVAD